MAIRLRRSIALSGDVASLTDRWPGERVAWGAGLSLDIPHTPHTLSLHATNPNNATLQSAARGTRETRYGFEFTIPVTLSRYFGGCRRAPDPAGQPSAPAAGSKDSITAVVQDFVFRPARLAHPTPS